LTSFAHTSLLGFLRTFRLQPGKRTGFDCGATSDEAFKFVV
jgi:hypothetical protein